jgi:hypothetical protein
MPDIFIQGYRAYIAKELLPQKPNGRILAQQWGPDWGAEDPAHPHYRYASITHFRNVTVEALTRVVNALT